MFHGEFNHVPWGSDEERWLIRELMAINLLPNFCIVTPVTDDADLTHVNTQKFIDVLNDILGRQPSRSEVTSILAALMVVLTKANQLHPHSSYDAIANILKQLEE